MMKITVTEDTFSRNWIRCRHVGCCESWVFRTGQDTHYEQLRVTHEKTCLHKPTTSR
jgi:hypothetical protein